MYRVTGKEINCPVCGKLFIIPPKNIYKIRNKDGTQHFCSYTCYKQIKEREGNNNA